MGAKRDGWPLCGWPRGTQERGGRRGARKAKVSHQHEQPLDLLVHLGRLRLLPHAVRTRLVGHRLHGRRLLPQQVRLRLRLCLHLRRLRRRLRPLLLTQLAVRAEHHAV